MAFLHNDARGFFYICESNRLRGRSVQKKLAYLGRMEVPIVHDAFMGTTSGPNAAIVRNGKYHKLCNNLFAVWLGSAKPTLALAYLYCRIVSGIVPEWKERDAKIVARAEKGLKIIQKNLTEKSQREIEMDWKGFGKADAEPCPETITLCGFYGASPMNWKRVIFHKLPEVMYKLAKSGIKQYLAIRSVAEMDAVEMEKRIVLVMNLLTGDGKAEFAKRMKQAKAEIPMPKTLVRELHAAGLSHLVD